MQFIQVIEYRTERPEEVQALLREWDESDAGNTAGAVGYHCADRDNPGTYYSIVLFPSYEAAMANSERPETTAFAERMQEVCDGPAAFRNLDVQMQLPTGG